MVDVPYQTLYRRYRPQLFGQILGQEHVVLALKNAVRDERVAHAYLFSGPRGTGKTSTARILAKGLNCENPVDGEPDGTCASCIRIQEGSSLDVHELDAASNNGVEAMRDLVSRAALGTPGRWKVYIVDEVHMLSTAASNALLKTLEEPPAHVVFVLATTDPQKVLPTIRSRTQHFEFRLLSPELLSQLVGTINQDAGLHVPSEALDLVVRRGKGSARDTLSVLDQVAAAGIVDDEHEVIDEIVEAICERDTGRALVAVAEAINQGRDAQRLGVDLVEYLRNGFLAMMSKNLVVLTDVAAAKVEAQARRLGAAALVRAMETIGTAILDMRDSPEQRVTLEVALVRLTKPELSTDPAALLQRIEKLESALASGASITPAASSSQPSPRSQQDTSRSNAGPKRVLANESVRPAETRPPAHVDAASRPAAARPALGGLRQQSRRQPETRSVPKPPEKSVPPAVQAEAPEIEAAPIASGVSGEFPTRDQLVVAWGDQILEKLPQRPKSRFRMGRFVSVANGKATYALPNAIHRDRCEEVRMEVEQALRDHFGTRIPLELTVDNEAGPTEPARGQSEPPADDYESMDLSETTSAGSGALTPEERVMQAFPGAEEVS